MEVINIFLYHTKAGLSNLEQVAKQVGHDLTSWTATGKVTFPCCF